MSEHFAEGEYVRWKWGNHWAEGVIVKKYTRKITLKIKGAAVSRRASVDEPAYKIKQADGDQVLKSHSELQAESQIKEKESK